MHQYHYVIIKNNNETFERESVLLKNNYRKSRKYAFINKGVNKNGSENIYYIDYSNDLEELQKRAAAFVSWYNYPIGLYKDMQQNISKLN